MADQDCNVCRRKGLEPLRLTTSPTKNIDRNTEYQVTSFETPSPHTMRIPPLTPYEIDALRRVPTGTSPLAHNSKLYQNVPFEPRGAAVYYPGQGMRMYYDTVAMKVPVQTQTSPDDQVLIQVDIDPKTQDTSQENAKMEPDQPKKRRSRREKSGSIKEKKRSIKRKESSKRRSSCTPESSIGKSRNSEGQDDKRESRSSSSGQESPKKDRTKRVSLYVSTKKRPSLSSRTSRSYSVENERERSLAMRDETFDGNAMNSEIRKINSISNRESTSGEKARRGSTTSGNVPCIFEIPSISIPTAFVQDDQLKGTCSDKHDQLWRNEQTVSLRKQLCVVEDFHRVPASAPSLMYKLYRLEGYTYTLHSDTHIHKHASGLTYEQQRQLAAATVVQTILMGSSAQQQMHEDTYGLLFGRFAFLLIKLGHVHYGYRTSWSTQCASISEFGHTRTPLTTNVPLGINLSFMLQRLLKIREPRPQTFLSIRTEWNFNNHEIHSSECPSSLKIIEAVQSQRVPDVPNLLNNTLKYYVYHIIKLNPRSTALHISHLYASIRVYRALVPYRFFHSQALIQRLVTHEVTLEIVNFRNSSRMPATAAAKGIASLNGRKERDALGSTFCAILKRTAQAGEATPRLSSEDFETLGDCSKQSTLHRSSNVCSDRSCRTILSLRWSGRIRGQQRYSLARAQHQWQFVAKASSSLLLVLAPDSISRTRICRLGSRTRSTKLVSRLSARGWHQFVLVLLLLLVRYARAPLSSQSSSRSACSSTTSERAGDERKHQRIAVGRSCNADGRLHESAR
ncbi:unnamed protein product, partial [Trichogramma brassicae]